MRLVDKIRKFNQNHKPAGSPDGGQFTTGSGSDAAERTFGANLVREAAARAISRKESWLDDRGLGPAAREKAKKITEATGVPEKDILPELMLGVEHLIHTPIKGKLKSLQGWTREARSRLKDATKGQIESVRRTLLVQEAQHALASQLLASRGGRFMSKRYLREEE